MFNRGDRGAKLMDELLKSLWGRIGYRLAAMRGKKTETIGIHCTAIGKVLMAWESVPRRDHILKGCDFKRFRDKTIITRADYDAELERTLAQGFGQDREEFDDHIRCLAVPIFDRLGLPVAGMSVSFPSFRFAAANIPEVLAELTRASREISERLGCQQHPLKSAA